jgi:hypothetical protein
MVRPAQDHNREFPRIDRRWTRRHFAFYAVAIAALLGFVLSREQAMQWIADGVTAEYAGIDRPDSADRVAVVRANTESGGKPSTH